MRKEQSPAHLTKSFLRRAPAWVAKAAPGMIALVVLLILNMRIEHTRSTTLPPLTGFFPAAQHLTGPVPASRHVLVCM